MNSKWLGVAALVASGLITAASFLEAISPKYAVYALAVSAAISAFTEKLTSKKEDSGESNF